MASLGEPPAPRLKANLAESEYDHPDGAAAEYDDSFDAANNYWKRYWPRRRNRFQCLQMMLKSSPTGKHLSCALQRLVWSFIHGPELFVVHAPRLDFGDVQLQIISVHRCLPSAIVAAKQFWNQKKRTFGKFAIGGPSRDIPFGLHALRKRELIAAVEVSSFECFARGTAHVIIQRPAYGGDENCPWDGIAAGGCELRISSVVDGSKVDQEARSVFQNLDCVSALDRQKVATDRLFGSNFEETRKHSPLLSCGGLLRNHDRLSSRGYEAYFVEGCEQEGCEQVLSVWAETRDKANNIALRCRTFAYELWPWLLHIENEITVYAECHEIK